MAPCLNEDCFIPLGPLRAQVPRLDCLVSVTYFAITGAGLRVWIDYIVGTQSLDFLGLRGRGNGCSGTHIDGSGFFFQNILGCVIIAAAQEYKAELGAATYAGIGAGLCGSLTTFASWMEYQALAILQGKYLDAIAVFLGMLGASYCAHMFGKLLAHPRKWVRGFEEQAEEDDVFTACGKSSATMWILCISAYVASAAIGLGIAIWLGVVGEWEDLVAMGCAPLGALSRYILSLGNPKCPQFPIFTLAANLLGCLVYIGADAFEKGFVQYGSDWGDEVVSAAATGIGGCLSTVSTFINELRNKSIHAPNRLLYAFVSFAAALALFIPLEAAIQCFPH
mmetsp:Transcript_54462/g.100699  ORF Transcript_54462/g.100699 Transcript_54462/m.100699 type:complete len:337 (-) Transcript_54462:66-1076(-)